MARRYGRNQKRKARKEIARLSAEAARMGEAYQMQAGLASHMGQKLAEREETIREMIACIEAVSQYSVALPPEEARGVAPGGAWTRVNVLEEMPELSAIAEIRDEFIRFRSVDLFRLETFLGSCRASMSAAVHLKYTGGGEVAYFLSETAMRSMPREQIVKRIVPMIARELLGHLDKKMGWRR